MQLQQTWGSWGIDFTLIDEWLLGVDRTWRGLGIVHIAIGRLVVQLTWPVGVANRDLDPDALMAGDVHCALSALARDGADALRIMSSAAQNAAHGGNHRPRI